MVDKVDSLIKDIVWHMIGNLQRNKVKYVVGRASMIHSVDSLRLAEAVNQEAVKKGIVADILIEVNVAGELNKFGFKPEEVEAFVRAISGFRTGTFVEDNTLTVTVSRLKTKLGKMDNSDKNYIDTIRGVGYRWRER